MITYFKIQKIFYTLIERKYLIGSSSLISLPSMILIPLLFFNAPPAVASLLTFPWVPLLLPCSFLERCFKTGVLITLQFFLLYLFLYSPSPIIVHLLSISIKLVGVSEFFTLIHNRRYGVVIRASALQSVDLQFIIQVKSYQKTSKNGIHSFLVWRLAHRNSVENKPASLLVVSLGKALNGMPPPSCGRQVAGPSSLPVVVAQSDEKHANRT